MEELRASSTNQLPERRDSPRYQVDEDSVVLFAGQGTPLPGSVVDLSQDGCCIRTKVRCSLRVQWPVEVAFNINHVAFRFNGILQWTNGRDLLGIHFVNMLPQRMVELAKVICAIEAAAGVETANKPVAEPEARPLAESQINNSIGLEAVKIPVQTLATPAANGGADLQTTQAASARDRRKSLRHGVDTSATIFLVNIGSTLHGRILDLSLSGCRIRTNERFPVGIYTRVETEFRLEGLPFRLGGVIQAIHDRNSVGIRFLDLSERKQQQVTDLIDEIEQLRATEKTA